MKKAVLAVIIVVVLLIIAAVGYCWLTGRGWHCGKQGFFGWRHQQYEDNPYSNQKYHCGLGAQGWPYPPKWLGQAQCVKSTGKDGFAADQGHWPDSGVFGNLADTNPYGNYEDSLQALWPTYSTQRETRYWSAF